MTSVSTVWAFIKLSRPHFLVGGAVMYAVGASTGGVAHPGHYLLGQALVTSAQITAHYVNEYADVESDRLVANRTLFSGGSGVLSSDQLAPIVALRAALVTSMLAVVLAVVVAVTSMVAATLGMVALAVSWAYSMPPIRLLNTGWGELATSLVVAALVPAIGATANGGSISAELMWAMAALVPIHMAMMLGFELPDLDTDRAAGKAVLGVRIGRNATHRAMAGLYALTGAVGLIGTALDAASAGIAVAVALPFALASLFAANRRRYDLLAFSAVATLVAFASGIIGSG